MRLIYKNTERFCSDTGKSLRSYLKKINNLGSGFLILRSSRKFISVITDGDIRRMILENIDIDDKYYPNNVESIYVKTSDTYEYIAGKFFSLGLQVLPVLDKNMHVKFIATNADIKNCCTGFIMAGGEGLRLRPMTLNTPKPLLKIAGKSLIDFVISYMNKIGISTIEVSVNYKKNMIINHLRDKSTNQLTLLPIKENSKLGTAGSLKLSRFKNSDILLSNSDIITDLDFNKIIWTAQINEFDLVVCTRKYSSSIPFGVIELDKDKVLKVNEKPTYNYDIVAGIYFISGKIRSLIKNKTYVDMPELISLAIEKKYRVGSLDIKEDWIDIGQPEQFKIASQKYG